MFIKLKNGGGFCHEKSEWLRLGGITKLSGKRRRPFWVRITAGWEMSETGKARQIYRTLGYYATRKEAMLALSEYHKSPTDLVNRGITFAEVFDIWSKKQFEEFPSTVGGINAAFRRCAPLHNMKMLDIRAVHLQNVMDNSSATSRSTKINVKTVLTKTFRYCVENDIVVKDYSQFVTVNLAREKPTEANYFTREQLRNIFENLDFTSKISVGKKASAEMNLTYSILILLYTGMRISELLGVRCKDVNLAERVMRVRGTKTVDADRIVPIHSEILEIVRGRVALGHEYLVTDFQGNRFKYPKYAVYFFEKFMEKIGADGITPHATRHTFISHADRCGLNSVALKRIIGHANKTTTEGYTHKENADLVAEIDRFDLSLTEG